MWADIGNYILKLVKNMTLNQAIMTVIVLLIMPMIVSICRSFVRIVTELVWIAWKSLFVLLVLAIATSIFFPETAGRFLSYGILGFFNNSIALVQNIVGNLLGIY